MAEMSPDKQLIWDTCQQQGATWVRAYIDTKSKDSAQAMWAREWLYEYEERQNVAREAEQRELAWKAVQEAEHAAIAARSSAAATRDAAEATKSAAKWTAVAAIAAAVGTLISAISTALTLAQVMGWIGAGK